MRAKLGLWNDAVNWSNGVPGVGFNVIIRNATVNCTVSININSLTVSDSSIFFGNIVRLNSSVVTGASFVEFRSQSIFRNFAMTEGILNVNSNGVLNISTTFTWGGSARISATGGRINLISGCTSQITGSALGGANITLQNFGYLFYNPTSAFNLAENGQLINSGTMNITSNSNIFGSKNPAFVNFGNIFFASNATYTNFQNNGTVNIISGTLNFRNLNTITHSGSFISSNGFLAFNEGNHVLVNSGTFVFNGGISVLLGANVIFNSRVNFTNTVSIANGTISFQNVSIVNSITMFGTGICILYVQSSASLNITRNFNWAGDCDVTASAFGGKINLLAGSVNSIKTTAPTILRFVSLSNFGYIEFSPASPITMSSGSWIVNEIGGIFNASATYDIEIRSGSPIAQHNITNFGTIVVGAPNFLCTSPLENRGIILISSGNLVIGSTFNQYQGAVLNSSAIGSISFNGSGNGGNTINGVFFVPTCLHASGTTNINSQNSTCQNLTVSGGTLNINYTPNMDRFEVLGTGIVRFSANSTVSQFRVRESARLQINRINVLNSFEWLGALSSDNSQISSGFLILTETCTSRISAPGDFASLTLSATRLSNFGTMEYESSSAFRMSFSASITNEASGTITFSLPNAENILFGGPAFFNNFGNVFINSDLRTTCTWRNYGNITIRNSRLILDESNNFTNFMGRISLIEGTIDSQVPTLLQRGIVEGTGNFPNAVINTGAIIRPGGFLTTGTISVLQYNQSLNGTLEIDVSASSQFDFIEDQLSVSSNATLGGFLVVNYITSFRPFFGIKLDILTSSSLIGTFSDISLNSTLVSISYDSKNVSINVIQSSLQITSGKLTTAPVTSSRLTTSPLSTSPLTTVSVTTRALTSAVMTTSPLTTSPITTSPLSTSPIITDELTTSLIDSASGEITIETTRDSTGDSTGDSITSGQETNLGTTGYSYSFPNNIAAPSDSNVIPIAVGVSVGVVFIIVSSILGCFFLRKRAARLKKEQQEEMFTIIHSQGSSPARKKTYLQTPPMEAPKLVEIEIKHKLGGGNFGEVYLGIWNSTNVAAKKLKDSSHEEEFRKELAVLSNIGSHPNVVQFLGTFKDTAGSEYLIFEYCRKGSLVDYLRANDKKIPVQNSFEIILGICSGMSFLESKKIVHRDLSARNCLVTEMDGSLVAKVSDFGMSRNTLDKNYYSTSSATVPVRWTAPEAIKKAQFTSASDVWSFGVVVWEIFSYGTIPYEWLSNQDVVQQVSKGLRLQKPEECPPILWDIILQCWQEDSNQRPTFSVLNKSIKATIYGNAPEPSPPIIQNDGKETPYYNSKENYYQTQ